VVTERKVWVDGLLEKVAVKRVPEDLAEVGQVYAVIRENSVFPEANGAKNKRVGGAARPDKLIFVYFEPFFYFLKVAHVFSMQTFGGSWNLGAGCLAVWYQNFGLKCVFSEHL
jgi:hypothetical protein